MKTIKAQKLDVKKSFMVSESPTVAAGRPEEEPDFLQQKDLHVTRSIGIKKMARVFTKLYNKLCQQCRAVAMKNPRGPIDQYCERCQPIIKETLEGLR